MSNLTIITVACCCRKAWIVHDHGSVNGLVAVPPKKPFVYVMQLKNCRRTPTNYFLTRLSRAQTEESSASVALQFDGKKFR